MLRIKQSWVGRALLLPVLVVLRSVAGQAALAAQSLKVEINAKTNGGGGTMWYSTWWFWVLVGLFVIIVIVAITSRGRPARE